MIRCQLIVNVTVSTIRRTHDLPDSDVLEDGADVYDVVQRDVAAGRSWKGGQEEKMLVLQIMLLLTIEHSPCAIQRVLVNSCVEV